MLRHRSLWFVCFSLLSIPLSVSAQTTTGTVRGYIKDQNAAAVPDAEIQVTNTATGVARSTSSRADGSYVLPGLVPATYDLAVRDRKSTRLNSSHPSISYAVFCLKKKKTH